MTAALTSWVRAVRLVFDAAAASVAVVDADAERLRYVAADGAGAGGIVGVELPLDAGIAGWVASTQQAVIVDDLASDSRHAVAVAQAAGYVARAMVTLPLVRDAETVGVMQILDAGSPPQGADMEVLHALATHAADLVALEASPPAPAAAEGFAHLDAPARQAVAAALESVVQALRSSR